MENGKKVDDSSKTFISEWKERQERWKKEETERKAQEQAKWDALPEEEKQQILAQREAERLEHEKRKAEREREEQINKWKKNGIPPRFYDETWDTWIADTPDKQKAKEIVRQAWAKNLFIIGNNGTGKTHMAMCLVKEGATYCKTAKLFRIVRDDLKLEQKTIDNYGSCKLLILDEAGRQKGTNFERDLLFEIIDRRWDNMLPTTIIGNIDKKEFADLYGLATLDRLRPETVVFNWGSKRT